MSYGAQGWAQRQVFGSPILKGVMQALCYLMRDDELNVYASVETLEKYSEYEERAIRKALRDLVDLGFLQDTGERRRNVVVWRMPRYEAWLARAENENPPVLGRGRNFGDDAPSQATETPLEKMDGSASDKQPSREGEGFPRGTATPPVQGSDPSRPGVTTPPVQGSQSSLNPGSTKPPAAIRLEDWRAKARVLTERAPEKATKDTPPGTVLKAHWKFWKQMVGWYGALWLHQWGCAPTPEWIRLLNLWNDSGRWTELDQVIDAMTLDRPTKPPMQIEVEEIFRKLKAIDGPKFDATASMSFWMNFVRNQVFRLAPLYDLAKYGCQSWEEIPNDRLQRDRVQAKCSELIPRAMAREQERPLVRQQVITEMVIDEIIGLLKQLKLPAPMPASEIDLPEAAFH